MEIDVVILAAGSAAAWGLQSLVAMARRYSVRSRLSGIRWLGRQTNCSYRGRTGRGSGTIVNACGFTAVYNEKPEAGQSRSLALGIAALADSARPVLCAVADQPLMTKEAAGQMQSCLQ